MESRKRAGIGTPSRWGADHRFNFAACFIDSVGWYLGLSFLSPTTILPYFVRNLTDSNLAVGAIPAIGAVGTLLPQLFSAPSSERRPIQRHFVLAVAMVERLPFLALATATFLMGFGAPGVLLAVFFLCLAANAVAMGLNMPAYAAMVSKVIPAERRGRLFGMGNGISGVLAVGGAAVSRWLLETYPPRVAFSLCFLIGFAVLVATVLPLGFVREPAGRVSDGHQPFSVYLRNAAGILRRDGQFARFLASQVMLSFALMAPAFYTVQAMERFGIPKDRGEEIGVFTMALMLSTMVGGFLWGHMADRRGNRIVLALGTAALVVLPVAALHAPSVGFFTALFFISGLTTAAWDLASFNLVMEFCPPERVPTYSALRAVAIGPVRGLTPILAGVLTDAWAQTWGYAPVFWTSSIAGATSLLLLLRMREPRHERDTRAGSLVAEEPVPLDSLS